MRNNSNDKTSNKKRVICKGFSSFTNSRVISPANRQNSAEKKTPTERKGLIMNSTYINISKRLKDNKESTKLESLNKKTCPNTIKVLKAKNCSYDFGKNLITSNIINTEVFHSSINSNNKLSNILSTESRFIDIVVDPMSTYNTNNKNSTNSSSNEIKKFDKEDINIKSNIECPEELHFVQVSFFQQNKLLSNKFG
jgi:hypothetical protein